MSDNDNLEGVTPAESPTENQATEEAAAESVTENSQTQPVVTTPEEEAFNSLSGSAQDRFRTIIQERNEARNQLTRQAQQDDQKLQPPAGNQGYAPTGEDDVQRAVDTLKQRGMVTRDELDNLYWTIQGTREHEKLESEYDGSEGKPKYVREEVEDYASRKGMGNNYRAAFRDMYFDELADARRTRTKKRVYSEKPRASTSGSRQEPLTLESFRKKLASPKGREYYEKLRQNPEELNKLLQSFNE